LWGEQPPATAAKTLQSHVKRLRRVLEPDRARGAAGQVLITRPPGYLLRVEPGTLDATRFEELTAKAARALADGAARAAGSMLREALGLWRGQAFEEFADSDVAAAEADRLGELRLGAVEDRLEAELRLGRHRELVAELEGLIRKYPLRERLWAQLMLAVYRAGRQADALLAYQRARSVLVEELGIDPGAELRRVHVSILAQDPGLDLPTPAEASPARELPEALKPTGPVFAGRAAELTWLRAAWSRATDGRGGLCGRWAGHGQDPAPRGACPGGPRPRRAGAVRPLPRVSVRPAAAVRGCTHERQRTPIGSACARSWPVSGRPRSGACRRAGRPVRPGGPAGLG
jgi:DNA-binding SARP family transcriptional activator